MKAIVIVGIVLGACTCAMAATWTGGGDGASWGDPANWGGQLPGATEIVEIATGSQAKTISVGATDRVIGELSLVGSGKLTISGAGSLALSKLTSAIDVTFDAPVTFKDGSNTIHNKVKVIEFLKPVTVLGANKGFTFASDQSSADMYVRFRDTFTAPGTTIYMKMGNTGSTQNTSVHFYGKLTAAKLSCCSEGYRSGWCYLYASNNEIGYAEVCYGGIVLLGENALPATMSLNYSNYYRESNPGVNSYNFTGTDQVAEAVRCPKVFNDERNRTHFLSTFGGVERTTLTLKGQSDAVANCEVGIGISLVWDPLGDYVQEFICQKSITEGSIEVKRGTFKIGAGASFADLSVVKVETGAKFELATEVVGALANLTRLEVASGGRFKASAASVNAFSSQETTAYLATGAMIETETTLVFQQVKIDGVPMPAGTYGADATPAAWLTGSGTVQVLGGAEFSKEIRTWTGSGDGVTWSDDANWDTGAPRSRDTARFTVGVTVESDIELESGPRKIEVANGCEVTLSGSISGSSDIVKVGAGELYLTGDNSFSGTLFINGGRIYGIGENSLGSGSQGVIDLSKDSDTTQCNLVLSGVTLRKELIVRNKNDAANGYAQSVRCVAGTENTLLGKLTVPQSYLRMDLQSNSKLVIGGGATFNTSSFFACAAGAQVIVRNVPITHNIYQDAYSGGMMVYDCVGNSIKQYNTTSYNRGMQMRMETRVDGALNESTWFYMGKANGSGVSTFDLCGTTQRISRIEAIVQNGALAPRGTITSDEPATLTMTSDNTYTNACIFAGAVSLEQAGEGTLLLTEPSTTTGALIASAGTIVMGDEFRWQGAIEMRGGTVRVPSAVAIGSKSFVSLESGTLDLAAGEYIFAGARDAEGNTLPPGRYAATAGDGVQALAGLAGDGVVTILPSGGVSEVYTWTGAAGDGRFSSAGNWEGGDLPDFSNAQGEYVFPGNGFTAIVDADVIAKRFEFPAQTADAIRLEADGETGGITFMDGSLVVTGAVGAAKSVTFDVPVKYAVGFNVHVGDSENKATANHSLRFVNKLSTLGSADMVKVGYGDWTISGDANYMVGDIVVSNGYVKLCGADPLGGEGTFRMSAPLNCNQTKVQLLGTTVTRPMWFTHESDGNGHLMITSVGVTNFINGKVTCAKHHFRTSVEKNSETHFRGGLQMAAFFLPYGQHDRSGTIFIEEVPVKSGSYYWSDNIGDMISSVLVCEGNSFAAGWNVYNTIETRVDYAFASDQKITFNYWSGATSVTNGLLDIRNTRQEIASCSREAVTTNSQGVVLWTSQARVTGTSGSQLKLNGAANVLNLPTFIDAASYVHAGTATRYFRDACSSTGELVVASGTLVMAAPREEFRGFDQSASPVLKGGAWMGPEVRISGGVLDVHHANAFNKKVNFSFIDVIGKINIPEGVSIPCAYIYVDGVRRKIGTYSAENFADHITGGGAIVSRGLANGTVLVLR